MFGHIGFTRLRMNPEKLAELEANNPQRLGIYANSSGCDAT
jgi:hypothetical protein